MFVNNGVIMNLELFPADPRLNLLPRDGQLYDYGLIFPPVEAERWLQIFLDQVPWQADRVRVNGEIIEAARQVAWYGLLPYRYTGVSHRNLGWPPFLLELKARVETLTGEAFNACLLNRYRSGAVGLGWHSDNEPDMAPTIASLSFGAPRKFAFRHRTSGERRELLLNSGQLIVMAGQTQRHWLHALMKSRRVAGERVNLTFRRILPR